jgi:AsmA family/AsmA-like C-terminal region
LQTTLLSIGIALILALVTALVGPLFVDWSRFRSEFEARTSQIAGQPVRITGAIDVRLLPIPIVRLQGVEVGPPGRAPAFGTQGLDAELSLASLMRGQLRAAVVRFEGPHFALQRDAAGQVAGPTLQTSEVSIERIVVRGGRLAFADVKSGADARLENVFFSGEMKAPGSVRGEGSFAVEGQPFKYRVAISRAPDGGVRLSLALDPSDRPLTLETEGLLTFANDVPRYEGNLVLTRPAGLALSTGKTVASDPWRIESKVKVDPALALFEQVDFQYGPDERAVRLTGAAELKIGAGARLNGVLSARQIDLDRPLATAEKAERLPLAVLRRWSENFSTLTALPIPMTLGIGIDAVTLGGATVQAVRADLSAEGDAVIVDSLEFRAPGFTHLALSGRLDTRSWQYTGPLTLDVPAPPAFLAWLGGIDFQTQAVRPFRLRCDVELSRERIMFDRARAEYDRGTAEGRLGYRFATEKRPARLDVGISAPAFDLDHAISLGRAILAGTGSNAAFDRPGEIALAVDLGRVTFAGVEAKTTKADLALDSAGLNIAALSIADFGGTAITGRGRIDAPWESPRGSLTLSLDAKKLDGLLALVATASPRAADLLGGNAARIVPAKVDATFDLEPTSSDTSVGLLDLKGNLGAMQVVLSAQAVGKLRAPETAELRVSGKVTSRDDALLAALGLDGVFAGKRGASLTWRAEGPAGGDLAIDVQLSGAAFGASARGAARFAEGEPRGTAELSLTAADLPWLQRTDPFPVALKTRVAIVGGVVVFSGLAGEAGGTPVRGEGSIGVGQPLRVDARLATTRVDFPAILASAIGVPPRQGDDANWSTRPFRPLAQVEGRVLLEADRVTLASAFTAENFRGTLAMTPQNFSFQNIAASVGGGALSAEATFTNGAGGLATSLRMLLTNADATAVLPGAAHPPIIGRISSKIDLRGTGSSPAALIASLNGSGSVTLEGADIAGLDPAALDLAVRAIDRGTPVVPARIADLVVRAMDAGSLKVPWASVPLAISTGRVRIGKMVTPAPGNEMGASGTLDLLDATVDARLTLFGANEAGQRPEASVVWKGPIAAPRRSVDVSALTGWLTLQSANREAKRLDTIERAIVPRSGVGSRTETGGAATTQVQPPAAPALPPPTVINRPPSVAAPRPAVRAVPAPPLFTPQ